MSYYIRYTSNVGEMRRELARWTEQEIAEAKFGIREVHNDFTAAVVRAVHVQSGALKSSVRPFFNDRGDEVEASVSVGDAKAYYAAWERARDGHDFLAGMTEAESAIDAVMDGKPRPTPHFDSGEAAN